MHPFLREISDFLRNKKVSSKLLRMGLEIPIGLAAEKLNHGNSRRVRDITKAAAFLRICDAVLDGEMTRGQVRAMLSRYIRSSYFADGWDKWFERKLRRLTEIRELPPLEERVADSRSRRHGTWARAAVHMVDREPLCSECAIVMNRMRRGDGITLGIDETDLRPYQHEHLTVIAEAVAEGTPLCLVKTPLWRKTLQGSSGGAARHRANNQALCQPCADVVNSYARNRRQRVRDAANA